MCLRWYYNLVKPLYMGNADITFFCWSQHIKCY